MALLAVIVSARHLDSAVVDVVTRGSHRLDFLERDRRRGTPVGDRGQQCLLPLKPLHLPCAERHKHAKGRNHKEKAGELAEAAAPCRLALLNHDRSHPDARCCGIAD